MMLAGSRLHKPSLFECRSGLQGKARLRGVVCSLYQLAQGLQAEAGKAQEQPSSSEASFLSAVANMAQAHDKPAAESQQNGRAADASPVDLMDMVGLGPRTQETSTGPRKQADGEVRACHRGSEGRHFVVLACTDGHGPAVSPVSQACT